MCTLVLAVGIVPDHPLVVVANRDEQLGRASAPPSWWNGFFAPRDLVAGGTWLGLNEHGLFVAITNRFLGPREATRLSRGKLVVDALGCTSAREAHERMKEIDPASYNGFHLVYADGNDVLATVGDGSVVTQLRLGRGLTIITERSFGAADAHSRIRRIQAAWQSLATSPFDPVRMTKLLTEHDPSDLLGSTCIHLPDLDYGTRSGFVLAQRSDRATKSAFWADGPPCTTPFSALDLAKTS